MRRLLWVGLVLGALVVPSWPARAATTEVSIEDSQFSPSKVGITVGDTVVWTNYGENGHSATSDDGSFDSSPGCVALTGVGCMTTGQSFSHTFNSPGTFTYRCRVHGSAMGSVVVTSANTSTTTTTTASTTVATTSSTSETSTSLASDQPTVTQAALPSIPPTSRVALPKSILRSRHEDDLRPWVFVDVAIAGTTTIAGIVLVRRGRVRLG